VKHRKDNETYASASETATADVAAITAEEEGEDEAATSVIEAAAGVEVEEAARVTVTIVEEVHAAWEEVASACNAVDDTGTSEGVVAAEEAGADEPEEPPKVNS
jgi:hypothetical protein